MDSIVPGLTQKPIFARKTNELIQDIRTLSSALEARVVQLELYNPKLSDRVKNGVRRQVVQIIGILDELNRTYDHLFLQHPEL